MIKFQLIPSSRASNFASFPGGLAEPGDGVQECNSHVVLVSLPLAGEELWPQRTSASRLV
jgi:hypothetical protein